MHLHVEGHGSGPRVVLIHADVATGASAWRRQLELADSYRLVIPDRPGYGQSTAQGRVDFEREVEAVLPLLDGGAHLVGHSYGGVVSLLAAAARPSSVLSLTVVEPPAFALAPDLPEVREMVSALERVWAEEPDDPERFFSRFAAIIGERAWPRSPMPEAMADGVRQLMAERVPWEAQIDVATIREAGIPVMVVSGGHAEALELLCDRLAGELSARREVVAGARHAVPRVGPAFNDLLRDFLPA
ncbi:alpha/beta fold hydrolase [Georgenia sp. Z1491]|uniref:alpha/beta fold hydrolase n=1 Tax=Georgenia sp. Z1491 TaxID=3416707 RepID=UPI003CF7EE20